MECHARCRQKLGIFLSALIRLSFEHDVGQEGICNAPVMYFISLLLMSSLCVGIEYTKHPQILVTLITCTSHVSHEVLH